jgi:transcriptional regulator with XRE-family HTH domain
VTTPPETPLDPDEPVGALLARMRRAKGWTGVHLAAQVGFSQPKISRIEHGTGVPDLGDIRRIAEALGAGPERVHQIVELAERSQNRMTDWRPTPVSLAVRQHDVGRWEAAAKVFRNFESSVVCGLLQTSGYARAILEAFDRLDAHNGSHPSGAPEVLGAVSARIQRQEILADRGKTFHFVMAETVLKNRLCSPAEMVVQIDHLSETASLTDRISVRFVPEDAAWDIAPQHGFTVVDDTLVAVDLYNTGLGRADALSYRSVFETYEKRATADIAPILAKYRSTYADLR